MSLEGFNSLVGEEYKPYDLLLGIGKNSNFNYFLGYYRLTSEIKIMKLEIGICRNTQNGDAPGKEVYPSC